MIKKSVGDDIQNIVNDVPQSWTDLVDKGLLVILQKNGNEISLKISWSKKLMFADIHNYKLFKTDLNTTEQRFSNISEVVDHQKEVVQNKIFETESKVIGFDIIQPPEIPITIQK